jgi:hypothetical protein
VISIKDMKYDSAAVAERPIAAALRAVWSRTGPHGFKSHPPRFYPLPNGTGSLKARISGRHPLYGGSIPLPSLIQHDTFRVKSNGYYVDIKIMLDKYQAAIYEQITTGHFMADVKEIVCRPCQNLYGVEEIDIIKEGHYRTRRKVHNMPITL